MYNAGDFAGTETVMIPLNTFTSDDPSASVTVTNLANTDVYIYKDASLTERSSSAGVAVDIDIETGTGCHWITIDLSDNTDAGFYASGSQYLVRVEGITVDAATLNVIIGGFSIGKVQAAMTAALVAHNLDHLCLTVTAAADMTTEVADNTILSRILANGDTSAFVPSTDGLQPIRDHVGDGTNLTEAGATGNHLTAIPWNSAWDAEVESEATDALNAYDPPTNAEIPTVAEISDGVWDEAATGHTDAGKAGEQLWTDLDAVLADTNELQVDDVPGLIAALNDLSAANVNAEVVDALATDTYGEPTGVPAATDALATKIGYIYMALRNKVTVTATKKTFYDDADAAEWEKDLSDDATTYTETEANAI